MHPRKFKNEGTPSVSDDSTTKFENESGSSSFPSVHIKLNVDCENEAIRELNKVMVFT